MSDHIPQDLRIMLREMRKVVAFLHKRWIKDEAQLAKIILLERKWSRRCK